MMLNKMPSARLIVIALVATAVLVAISLEQSCESTLRDDLANSDESESATYRQDRNENASTTPAAVQESNSASTLSFGLLNSLVIPTREAPAREHPAVVAAYAGENHDLFNTLVELGDAGNAVASYSAYKLLRKCNSLNMTEEELDTAINRLYETRNPPHSSPENISDRFNPKTAEVNMRRTFAQCRAIPEDQISNRTKWLRKAAQDGSSLAIQEYGDSIVHKRPKEAFHEYNRLWELGGAMGADKLSKMYATGWQGQEPDLVKAAAYGYIATQSMLDYFDSIDNIYGSTIFEQVKLDHVEIQRGYLMRIKPAEQDRAVELAQDLLDKNPNCCFN